MSRGEEMENKNTTKEGCIIYEEHGHWARNSENSGKREQQCLHCKKLGLMSRGCLKQLEEVRCWKYSSKGHIEKDKL